jgi:sec-independent protein translocase protein TatA
MFGMGAQELLLILVLVLLLFGAKRIPEIARGLGKSLSEFKKGMREIDSDVRSATEDEPKKPGSATSENKNKE